MASLENNEIASTPEHYSVKYVPQNVKSRNNISDGNNIACSSDSQDTDEREDIEADGEASCSRPQGNEPEASWSRDVEAHAMLNVFKKYAQVLNTCSRQTASTMQGKNIARKAVTEPINGTTAFFGEDGSSEYDVDDPDAFRRRKRERYSNWKREEVEVLLSIYAANAHVLNETSMANSNKRRKVFMDITTALRRINDLQGNKVPRSLEQVRRKYKELRSNATKHLESYNQAVNSGKKPPEIPDFLKRVITLMNIKPYVSGQEEEVNQDRNASSDNDTGDLDEASDGNEQSGRASRKRERHSNWNEVEIEAMFQVYKKNVQILNDTSKESMPERRKVLLQMMVAINRIHDLQGNGLKRSYKQVRKKWNDFRHMILKQWESYNQAVLSGESPPAIPHLMKSMMSLMGIGPNINKTETDDAETRFRYDVEMKEDWQRGDCGDDRSPNRCPETVGKRERNANWTDKEVEALLEVYSDHAQVLNESGCAVTVRQQKRRVFLEMTKAVNRVNFLQGTGWTRSFNRVKRKCFELRYLATKQWERCSLSIQNGESPPEIPGVLKRVMVLMGIGQASPSSLANERAADNELLKSGEITTQDADRGSGSDGEAVENVTESVPDWDKVTTVPDSKQLVIQTHLCMLSRTCEQLAKLGVDASGFVVAAGRILTCGSQSLQATRLDGLSSSAVLEVQHRPSCNARLSRQMFDSSWRETVADINSDMVLSSAPVTNAACPWAPLSSWDISRILSVSKRLGDASSSAGRNRKRKKRKLARKRNFTFSRGPGAVPRTSSAEAAFQPRRNVSNHSRTGIGRTDSMGHTAGKLALDLHAVKAEPTSDHEDPEHPPFLGFSRKRRNGDILSSSYPKANGMKLHLPMSVDGLTNVKESKEISDDSVDVSSLEVNFMNEKVTEAPHFKCETCDRTFKNRPNLLWHEASHIKKTRKFQCELCPKLFRARYQLKNHRLVFHCGVKPFQCEKCGTGFTEKHNLRTHMRIHDNDRPFKCDYCPRAYYMKSTLTVHLRRHTGERPFLCDDCGAAFFTGNRLRTHLLSHTGEKPQVCDDCGMRFKERKELNIHRRIHTGIQPYVCQYCKKFFGTLYKLTIHERLHTGEKPFGCEICGERFMRTDVLRLHKKKHADVR